ncbi:MAG: prephenate dehydrogenase/arogenate dehydrogenase family protein [Thermoplasmatota archaeon]
MSEALEPLRTRIAELDAQILALAAERSRLGQEVGRIKQTTGRASVDYVQEARVLERARRQATDSGLRPATAEEIVSVLIRDAVQVQESDRVQATAGGRGQTCVLLGGAGRMGRWMHRFLADHGYEVLVLDPAGAPDAVEAATSRLPSADLVLCAMPPSAIAAQYDAWAAAGDVPTGVVADIASIKAPLVDAIERLRAAGGRVASLHPLFGPGLVSLRGADVVLCDLGDADATAAVEALFEPTTARLWHLPLEGHDEAMAEVLALSHASAISFAAALGDAAPVHSSTFAALERLALDVVHESPEVYYEIQATNPHAATAVARLAEALAQLRGAVDARDPASFEALLATGRARLEVRQARRNEP